ncbi:MAG: hypothetical protein CBE07_003660 [Pelagibacteraceae bacterium TMED247]|nr:MAG: hypothetical protein CBE07_003660 [Pelagibacteraceae bacterium TMED247]|tara:strand:- start:5536 stop:5988 length:453 start_codon:yes stop_codon:yes gene_type:complete
MNDWTLTRIQNEWEKDCVIDDIELDRSSLQIPKLHAKYASALSHKKLALIKYENELKDTLKDKWLWFSGKLSKEEIDEKGWEFDPFNGLTVLKTDYDKFFDSDKDIRIINDKIEYLKVTIEFLSDVVSQLTWKHQTIKNIIEWRKFMAGS